MDWTKVVDSLKADWNEWVDKFIDHLPNIVLAILVISIAIILSKYISKGFGKFLDKTTKSKALVHLAQFTVRYAVIILGFMIALGILGLQKALFSMLAGAGIASLAIGFAFQDLAANFLSGVFIAFQRPFKIGDVISTKDFQGTVKDIHLRNTFIETFDGQIVVMPNRMIIENPLINFTRQGIRRICLTVGVSYDSDLKHVEKSLVNAIEKVDLLLEDKPIKISAQEFGDSSINFNVYYWIEYSDKEIHYLDAVHQGVLAIRSTFADEGINIPFPIRTLDFEMEGNPKLDLSGKGKDSEATESSKEKADNKTKKETVAKESTEEVDGEEEGSDGGGSE